MAMTVRFGTVFHPIAQTQKANSASPRDQAKMLQKALNNGPACNYSLDVFEGRLEEGSRAMSYVVASAPEHDALTNLQQAWAGVHAEEDSLQLLLEREQNEELTRLNAAAFEELRQRKMEIKHQYSEITRNAVSVYI